MINCLIARRILSSLVGDSLRAALTISLFARLSVYCHHLSQDDRMTIIEPMPQLKGGSWFFPRKLLIHYFLHCSLLVTTADRVIRIGDDRDNGDEYVLIWTLFMCRDCRSVIHCVESRREAGNEFRPVKDMYIQSLVEVGRHNKALNLLKRRRKENQNKDHISCRHHFIMGYIYMKQGHYRSALKYYRKSLGIHLDIHGDSTHPDIAALQHWHCLSRTSRLL
mgnify:CR=1 FL=1